jgi:FKBP-type peptidyl-prolyl cis-trans isomerase SlyD
VAVKIGKNSVVALDFKLSDPDGTVLEESDDPIGYLHGGYSGMFAAVEERLEGLEAGAQLSVRLEPGDAFGEYDESLKRSEPRSAFPRNVEVGMRFEGTGEVSGERRVYTVTSVAEEQVEVDGNHPYAGRIVDFHCTVRAVRPATREEISHGHVHGAGGHHH